MSLWTKTMAAINAAITAFSDPASVQNDLDVSKRMSEYAIAWHYFRNKMFNREYGDFTLYLNERGLYQHTKLVFNPVPEIVNFYIDNLWQHPFNSDYPMLSTPAEDNTESDVLAAIAQLDQWSNFSTESNKIKAFAAASGNVLIEGHADFDRQKITQKTIWASYVTDILLNDGGDVLSYTLEYDAYDAVQKKTYRYKKIADREKTEYFRDDKPYATENHEAVEINLLGFCFAVWIKHTDDGGIKGLPAVANYDKVAHTNSLACHLHDNIHKEIESGKMIGLEDPKSIEVVSGGYKNKDGTITEFDTRLERVILAAKSVGGVYDLSGTLKLAESHPYLKELIASFADDYPELQARAIIKEAAQLSGAALERMLTPAKNRLDRAAANYDRQLVKLRQMQISAGAYYLKNIWTNTNKQQQVFAPFDLNSFEQEKLDFSLKRSVLIEATEEEREDILTKKTNRAVAAQGFVDVRAQREIAGFSEAEIEEIEKREIANPPRVEKPIDLGVGV